MSNVNIDSGAIDGTTIATSNITVGSGKTLDVASGTLTLANDQISGDKVEGGTIGSITISQLAGAMDCNSKAMSNVNIDSGAIDGTTIGANIQAAGTFTDITATGKINIGGSLDSMLDVVGDISASGSVIFGGLSESGQVKALYYNTTTGQVTYDNSGGTGTVKAGSDASFTSVDISENLTVLGGNFKSLTFGSSGTQNTLPSIRGTNGQYLQTDGNGTLSWASVNAVNVTDSAANTNFPVVFHNESNGLLDDTSSFTYNPHLGKIGISGAIEAAYDLDTTSYLGRAAIGNMGSSDQASFAHLDNNSASSCSLRQTASGRTIINSANGQNIQFRINNQDKMRIGSDGKVGIGLGNSAPNHDLEINNDISASKIFTTDGSFTSLTSTKIGAFQATGAINFDSQVMTNVNIDSGTIDGATIATSNITVGSGKSLDVASGTLTLANDQISGDKIEGGTIGSITITSLTAGGNTFPSGSGTNGYYLQTNGSGTLSWAAVSAGGATTITGTGFKSNHIGTNVNSTGSISLGYQSGNTLQGAYSIGMGYQAGYSSQGAYSIAIGTETCKGGQGDRSIAMGRETAHSGQGNYSVAIGSAAQGGSTVSADSSVALGYGAGYTGQGTASLALGRDAGYTSQGTYCIAIGYQAGYDAQDGDSIAIGYHAAKTNQGEKCIAIGRSAGEGGQGDTSIAIGAYAAHTNSNGTNKIAIGHYAAQDDQKTHAVAIGPAAGAYSQGEAAIAIGLNAGATYQGTNSIAIGQSAGHNSLHDNCIAINGESNTFLDSNGTSRFFVKPIRDSGTETSNIKNLLYNTSTGEISHQALSGGGGFTTQMGDGIKSNHSNVSADNNSICIGNYSKGKPTEISIGYYAGQGSTESNSENINIGHEAHRTVGGNGLGSNKSIYIGYRTGEYARDYYNCVVGWGAGGGDLVANNMNNSYYINGNCTAIGTKALGRPKSGGVYFTTAVGRGSGESNAGHFGSFLGFDAGYNNAGDHSVAIGSEAGKFNMGVSSIAIGNSAGYTSQGVHCIAIGNSAGKNNQGGASIAIGDTAAQGGQGIRSIAIGREAALQGQGNYAVAIGSEAGNTNQGNHSIAIGYSAGHTNQHHNSIVLNTSGSALNTDGDSRFFVKPIRDATNSNKLLYNSSTGEITYQADSGGGGGFTTQMGVGIKSNHGSIDANNNSIVFGDYSKGGSEEITMGYYGLGDNHKTDTGYNIALGWEVRRYPSSNNKTTTRSVNIGWRSGEYSEGAQNVCVGDGTGGGQNRVNGANNTYYLSGYCTAIGANSMSVPKSGGTFGASACGYYSGQARAGMYSACLGYMAGAHDVGAYSIAIGVETCYASNYSNTVAIGYRAGRTYQKTHCVAIGRDAGYIGQGGTTNGGEGAVAIGTNAGKHDQGYKATAIGFWAGGNWNNNGGSGDFSVAIGADAGGSGGAPYKTIIINATGGDLSPSTQEAFFVKPIRSEPNDNKLLYNKITGEITYQEDSGGGGGSTFDTLTNSSSYGAKIHLHAGSTNGQQGTWRGEFCHIIGQKSNGGTGSIGFYHDEMAGLNHAGTSMQSFYINFAGPAVFISGQTNSSDDRIKHNEETITNGLETIRQLVPEKYLKGKSIDDQYAFTEAGFIAQKVLDISNLNFTVTQSNKELIEGDPSSCCYGLNYNSIFTYNVAATKELDVIVRDLSNNLLVANNKITQLETELANLRQENTIIKNALNSLLPSNGQI